MGNRQVANDTYRPTIPLAYVQLILDLLKKNGMSREPLIEGLGLHRSLFNSPESRFSRHDAGTILLRAMKLSDNPAMGYEVGLASGLTTHGLLGYGLMCASTLRDGLSFVGKYLPTRLPYLRLGVSIDARHAVIEVSHLMELGPLHACTFDLFLVGLYRLVLQASFGLLKETDFELRFDYPKPAYYAKYQKRLPASVFGQAANQLRFPAADLDAPLPTADPTTEIQVRMYLDQELALLGETEDFLSKMRAALSNNGSGYPDLEETGRRLNISARTLRRKLSERGVSFRKVVDDVLRRDAINLLASTGLSVEEVASRLGYSDPANFTRAFRRWTTTSPMAYRLGMHGERSRPWR